MFLSLARVAKKMKIIAGLLADKLDVEAAALEVGGIKDGDAQVRCPPQRGLSLHGVPASMCVAP